MMPIVESGKNEESDEQIEDKGQMGEESSEDDLEELERMYGMGRNNNKNVKVVHNARDKAREAA